MKNQNSPSALRGVLGVHVTPESIEAVLIRRVGERSEVVQRFTRSRAGTHELAGAESLALALPGLKGADDADYTLEVGDGSATTHAAFLPSELSGLGAQKAAGKKASDVAQAARAHPFPAQLKSILQECHALGYSALELAFCIAPPDASYVTLPASKTETPGNERNEAESDTQDSAERQPVSFSPTERKRLLALLTEQHPGAVDEERVAFLPLAPQDNTQRALAVVAEPTEPVSATLLLLREQSDALPPVRRLEAEVTAYAALFQRTAHAEPSERSAIVRVGAEDTLVLFFEGTRLLHAERLRSLSVFDLPETVCSRVILQQDEKKIGDLHALYLVGGGRSENLLTSFRSFFPDAAVEPLRDVLAESGIALPDTPDEPLRGVLLPAIAAGLSVAEAWPSAETTNLLSRQLQRRQRRRYTGTWPIALAVVALIAALAISTIRYTVTQNQINEERAELQANPPEMPPENPDHLQARVDSLSAAYATYTRALHVLDSLLVGSDRWIQTMAMTTRTVVGANNTWLTKWTPEGAALRLNGSALSRTNIVELSRRLNAAIEQVTYEDIGGRRVYNFEMVAVFPGEMPEAALYLRGTLPPDVPVSDELIVYPTPPLGEFNPDHRH